jgi:hypothetical protein
MTARRFWRLVEPAAIVAVLAGGCGGSSGNSTGTTLPAAVPTSVFANDTAKAQGALLTLADLPSRWTADGKVTTGAGLHDALNKEIDGQIGFCLGLPRTVFIASPPEADSPTFKGPDGNSTIDDEAQVFPTVSDASAFVTPLLSAKSSPCLNGMFTGPVMGAFHNEVASAFDLESGTGKVVPIARYGDGAGDVEFSAVITKPGLTINVVLDIIVVRRGRSVSTLVLTEPGLYKHYGCGIAASLDCGAAHDALATLLRGARDAVGARFRATNP